MYDEGIRTWQWVVTVIVIIILIVLGYYLFKGCEEKCTSPEALPEPKEQTVEERCKEIGMRYSIARIPAQCIKYFLNDDERKIYLENVKE